MRATNAINEVRYGYEIYDPLPNPPRADADEFPLDVSWDRAVMQDYMGPGEFFRGLTRDDVGGLRYLYNADNTKIESLLPGVSSVHNNPSAVVNTALRPGVNKITLARMMWNTNSGRFQGMTNVFDDYFITDGLTHTQTLQRIIIQPDILFRAQDFGLHFEEWLGSYYFLSKVWERSDTSTWRNNSALNGNEGGAGPGVIQPGATITFGQLGRYSELGEPHKRQEQWASFDDSPTPPLIFRGPEIATSVTITNRISWEMALRLLNGECWAPNRPCIESRRLLTSKIGSTFRPSPTQLGTLR